MAGLGSKKGLGALGGLGGGKASGLAGLAAAAASSSADPATPAADAAAATTPAAAANALLGKAFGSGNVRSAWLKAGAQVKVDVAPPKDLAAVAKAAHAIHVANEQRRAREFAAGKELAAEGEICDGYGRRISGKQLNQAAWRGRDIRAKAQAASAAKAVPLRNVKAPLGDRADLPPSRTSRSTPGSRGSKEMRV